MALEKITKVSGRGVYVPGDDIDTDRIIPARFMKCVTFDGLGEGFFYDVRKDENGNDRKHALTDKRFAGAEILVTGNNFGCGSSREHAPQAIARAGFRAIVAEGFAEIFFGNCTQLGIPCVTLPAAGRKRLSAAIEANPDLEITVDVDAREVRFGDEVLECGLRGGARSSLMAGTWDPLDELLGNAVEVGATASRLAYVSA